MGCVFREGRSEAAIQLHSLRRLERQRNAEARKQGGLPAGLLDLEKLRMPRSHLDIRCHNMTSSSIDVILESRERQATRVQQEAVRSVAARMQKEEAQTLKPPPVRGTLPNSW